MPSHRCLGLVVALGVWFAFSPPIARAQIVPGDFELVGIVDVDLADFAVMQNCFGQPTDAPTCDPVDLDNDFDIDLIDVDHYLCALLGPSVPPGPGVVVDPLPPSTVAPTVTVTGRSLAVCR